MWDKCNFKRTKKYTNQLQNLNLIAERRMRNSKLFHQNIKTFYFHQTHTQKKYSNFAIKKECNYESHFTWICLVFTRLGKMKANSQIFNMPKTRYSISLHLCVCKLSPLPSHCVFWLSTMTMKISFLFWWVFFQRKTLSIWSPLKVFVIHMMQQKFTYPFQHLWYVSTNRHLNNEWNFLQIFTHLNFFNFKTETFYIWSTLYCVCFVAVFVSILCRL